MYKHSTQKNHRHILEKHLLPQFGGKAIADVTRQEIQAYVARVTQAGYAPKTIDHIHDVLSAVLRTAVKWGHLQDNPAREVDMPALQTVRPKWALTNPRRVRTALVKKSASRSADQCARTNVRQAIGRCRLGGTPCSLRIRAIVDRPPSWPRFFKAP